MISARQIFSASAPPTTHRRKASCKEVECAQYLAGWETKVDVSTDLGLRQYQYIRHQSGRKIQKMIPSADGGNITTFVFCPNQECFREHTISLEREPILSIQNGIDRRTVEAGLWHNEMNDAIHKRQQDVGR